jgi:hypothetical protein
MACYDDNFNLNVYIFSELTQTPFSSCNHVDGLEAFVAQEIR